MTDTLLEQIKADRENGTQGPFRKTSDHEWCLDTGGENSYFVVAGHHGPFAIVAVERAFGMDDHNEADMRRVCAIPDMEARILRDAETIKAAEDMEKVARAMAMMIADSLKGTGKMNVAIRPDHALTLNDAFKYIAAFRATQEKTDE